MNPEGHRFSGEAVFKKPLPRDYGFSNKSEVEKAIIEEEKRTNTINKISMFTFMAVFISISGTAFAIIRFVLPLGDTGRSTTMWLFGLASANAGLILGILCTLIARATSRGILQPSSDYSRAKRYLDANRLWKRRLQREYGYESF